MVVTPLWGRRRRVSRRYSTDNCDVRHVASYLCAANGGRFSAECFYSQYGNARLYEDLVAVDDYCGCFFDGWRRGQDAKRRIPTSWKYDGCARKPSVITVGWFWHTHKCFVKVWGSGLLQLLILVLRCAAELLLDADELVVLGHTVGTRERTRLDLAAVGSHGDVGDGGVLRLARAV